ncbi:hypothetical protein CFOL_v3_04212 [Cephalotus follicularis]|uniref:Uncharacterized protein n=1 Tax=Cephalotus follicularis TaxID=3775 RepID=A0A1Q3AYQ9_CEPFO|nr:hypothetical protein CFOL_v3_04212 [Cephalotus follicularis]
MGSDRSSKHKKSKKRSSPSFESEDEGGSKRHRRGEEEERKSKKSDKKSHKSLSHKEKKSKDKHKSKHHKGDRQPIKDFHELSNDDYFLKNNEFATWLKEEKNVFFSELSSESARELFSDFAKAWNSQKLESSYYEGIASGPRSSHNWKFKK